MTDKVWRFGYEAQVFIGTSGTTAATQIINRTKCNFEVSADMVDVTVAETAGTIPYKAEHPVAVGASLNLEIMYDSNDANVATLINACAAGTLIALRTRRFPTTGPGFDGDVYVSKVGGDGDIKNGQMIPVDFAISREKRVPSFNAT